MMAAMLLWSSSGGKLRAQDVYYSGSLQYATGSYYFTERTGSFYFSNSLGMSGDKGSVYFSIPLITQNTPWVSYTRSGTLPTGGPQSRLAGTRQQQQGGGRGQRKHTIDLGKADTVNFSKTHFGDPSLSANIKLWSSPSARTSISSNWGVKIPFTDENSGYGTGGWDVGGGISWSQRIQQKYLMMLSGMYWVLGDMNDLNLNNMLSYSAALGRMFKDGKWMTTASLFGSTEIIDEVDPPVSIGAGLNYRVSAQINLSTNMMIGLTESASDFSIGVGWSINF